MVGKKNEIDKLKSKNFIVCYFCDYKSTRITELLSHIVNHHFSYKPFTCRICKGRYGSMLDFVQHGSKHTEIRELDFDYESSEKYDDWLRRITNYLINEKHLKVNDIKDCYVCSKYSDYFKSINYKTLIFKLEDCKIDEINEFRCKQLVRHPRTLIFISMSKEQVVFLYHLHIHLQYFPYKCTKCIDKEYRLPFIGKEFLNHLETVHNLKYSFTNDNKDCFEKKFYIEQLDKIVSRFYVEKNKKHLKY